MVRRCRNKFDLLRHQRLYVRTITAGDDELQVDADLFEEVASTAYIDRHVAQALRRLRDLDPGQALRQHDRRGGDRGTEDEVAAGEAGHAAINHCQGSSCFAVVPLHCISLPLPTDAVVASAAHALPAD